MRKISFVILAVLLCFAIQGFAECPKPFEKVKEYAVQGEMVKPGIWLNRFAGNENGKEFEFRFVYGESDNSICIGGESEENYRVFCWHPDYGCAEYLNPWIQVPMNDTTAEEELYKLFRRMVELGLL